MKDKGALVWSDSSSEIITVSRNRRWLIKRTRLSFRILACIWSATLTMCFANLVLLNYSSELPILRWNNLCQRTNPIETSDINIIIKILVMILIKFACRLCVYIRNSEQRLLLRFFIDFVPSYTCSTISFTTFVVDRINISRRKPQDKHENRTDDGREDVVVVVCSSSQEPGFPLRLCSGFN